MNFHPQLFVSVEPRIHSRSLDPGLRIHESETAWYFSFPSCLVPAVPESKPSCCEVELLQTRRTSLSRFQDLVLSDPNLTCKNVNMSGFHIGDGVYFFDNGK